MLNYLLSKIENGEAMKKEKDEYQDGESTLTTLSLFFITDRTDVDFLPVQ